MLSALLNKTFPSFLVKYSFNFQERERNVLFNDTLDTFYLHAMASDMLKDHSDSETL